MFIEITLNKSFKRCFTRISTTTAARTTLWNINAELIVGLQKGLVIPLQKSPLQRLCVWMARPFYANSKEDERGKCTFRDRWWCIRRRRTTTTMAGGKGVVNRRKLIRSHIRECSQNYFSSLISHKSHHLANIKLFFCSNNIWSSGQDGSFGKSANIGFHLSCKATL